MEQKLLEKLLKDIPDYQAFLTVDEMDESSKRLADEYPDKVAIFEAGKSRKGHPIYCLKIGAGPLNAFMFGCPHPNEPMGAMMLEYFSRKLAEDDELREALGYTWYLIKSIDVDGTQLNEGWFKGPITLTNYTRHYFRPAGYEQAEWTFPMDYKNYHWNTPIPETQTLMRIIDETKPAFMFSLHNAGFGGTYWYVSKDMPELWDKLYAASERQGIPLHLGEPEVNYIKPFAPAIFPFISLADEYDQLEKFATAPPETLLNCGESSDAYARKYGTTALVCELPYFYEPRIMSQKEMPFTRREAALKKLKNSILEDDLIEERYNRVKALISSDNPFAKMVDVCLKDRDQHAQAERGFIESNDAEYARPCKESEAFDNLELPKFYRLFMWTLLIRACEHELEKDRPQAEVDLLSAVAKEAENRFNERAAEAERDIHYQVTPIRRLIGVQLTSGMLIADYVKAHGGEIRP